MASSHADPNSSKRPGADDAPIPPGSPPPPLSHSRSSPPSSRLSRGSVASSSASSAIALSPAEHVPTCQLSAAGSGAATAARQHAACAALEKSCDSGTPHAHWNFRGGGPKCAASSADFAAPEGPQMSPIRKTPSCGEKGISGRRSPLSPFYGRASLPSHALHALHTLYPRHLRDPSSFYEPNYKEWAASRSNRTACLSPHHSGCGCH